MAGISRSEFFDAVGRLGDGRVSALTSERCSAGPTAQYLFVIVDERRAQASPGSHSS